MTELSLRNEEFILKLLKGYEMKKCARIVKQYRKFFDRWLSAIRNNRCPICGKTFSSRQKLLTHLRRSRCKQVLIDIARRILEGEDPEKLYDILT